MHGTKHSATLTLQRQAAVTCIELRLYTEALEVLEMFFENAHGIQNFIQIADVCLCVVAQFHLENYDAALELIEVAFLEFAQVGASNEPQALMELHFQRAQIMMKQNRWMDAKIELETCLSFVDCAPTHLPLLWNATAALASATAKCGDIFTGEKIIRQAVVMAFTAHGTHGFCTLIIEHLLARFLFETFSETSAQRSDAEATIIRTVEAKRLFLGDDHSSTILSMQLMCEVLSQSDKYDSYETALLDLLSSCQIASGWLHIETINVLFQLAVLYDHLLQVERAELLFMVGICLLGCISCEQAALLASKNQTALLKLYRTTSQSDKLAVLCAEMRRQGCHSGEQMPAPFISRNFSVEVLKESMYPQHLTQLFHQRMSDL